MANNTSASTADITAAAVAGATAKANGGGDVAVYEAREKELATIRDRALSLASIDRNSALAKADLWGGKRGETMRANAAKDYGAAVSAANSAYYDALDAFAVNNNFLSMVDGDRALEILGRRVENAREAFAKVFEAAAAAGFDTLPSTSGQTYNVAEMLDTLNGKSPAAAQAA